MRLDAYMSEYWPERSRAQWQKLIADSHVRVNGQFVTKSSYELGEDDEVTVKAPKLPVLDGTIDVLYEDDDVLVMNKDSGILSHAKGIMPDEFTVAEFVRRHLQFTPETNDQRAGIVPRHHLRNRSLQAVSSSQPKIMTLRPCYKSSFTIVQPKKLTSRSCVAHRSITKRT